MRYCFQLYNLYVSIFTEKAVQKTHISIDICMRVNIKIPATSITDASSCSFPLVILQEMDGQMKRGLLLVYPMEHHGIPSLLKGPLASHINWFMICLYFNLGTGVSSTWAAWLYYLIWGHSSLKQSQSKPNEIMITIYTLGLQGADYFVIIHYPGNTFSGLQ